MAPNVINRKNKPPMRFTPPQDFPQFGGGGIESPFWFCDREQEVTSNLSFKKSQGLVSPVKVSMGLPDPPHPTSTLDQVSQNNPLPTAALRSWGSHYSNPQPLKRASPSASLLGGL